MSITIRAYSLAWTRRQPSKLMPRKL